MCSRRLTENLVQGEIRWQQGQGVKERRGNKEKNEEVEDSYSSFDEFSFPRIEDHPHILTHTSQISKDQKTTITASSNLISQTPISTITTSTTAFIVDKHDGVVVVADDGQKGFGSTYNPTTTPTKLPIIGWPSPEPSVQRSRQLGVKPTYGPTFEIPGMVAQGVCNPPIPGCDLCVGSTNCCATPVTSPFYGMCTTSDDFNCPDSNKILCTSDNCPGTSTGDIICNYVLGKQSTATNRWGSLFCTSYKCSAINVGFCFSDGNDGTVWKACDTAYCNHSWPPSKSPSSTSAPAAPGPGGGPKPVPAPTYNPSYVPSPEPTYTPSGGPSPYPTKTFSPTDRPVAFTCPKGFYVAITVTSICVPCPGITK